jgi:hypothetical protein
MDNGSIAGRVERLRREIQLIQQGEHRYRIHRGHSPAHKEDHLNRESESFRS